jgi:hypothetical protein
MQTLSQTPAVFSLDLPALSSAVASPQVALRFSCPGGLPVAIAPFRASSIESG